MPPPTVAREACLLILDAGRALLGLEDGELGQQQESGLPSTASNRCRSPRSPPPLQHQAPSPAATEAPLSTTSGLSLSRTSIPASPFGNAPQRRRVKAKRRRVDGAYEPQLRTDDVLAWLEGWRRLARKLDCDATGTLGPPLQLAAAADVLTALLPGGSCMSAGHPAHLKVEGARSSSRQAASQGCVCLVGCAANCL